jgi:glutathione S-transferase
VTATHAAVPGTIARQENNARMARFTLVIGNKNYSSWSLRAWLALRQTGAAFDEVVIPLDRADTAQAIQQWSPAGKVPVLIDGDLTVWDSLAIGEYLAEQYPEAGLWPSDAAARAVARSAAAEMHSGFAALRRDMPMDVRRRTARTPSRDVAADIARICALWHECRARFGGGHGDFLFGDFTLADAVYAPVASRLVTYGVELPDTARAYVDAIMAAPAMRAWADAAAAEPWVIDDP